MAEDCTFCAIASGRIQSSKVYDGSNSMAFLDINPRNPGHTLVIPKRHYETILDMSGTEAGRLFEDVRRIAAMVKNGTKAQGISISQSNGKAAGQVVPHVHFHIIPRFVTEAPAGLEGFMPAKRLDDESTKKIAETIRKASAEEKGGHEEERYEERLEEKPRTEKHDEKKKKKPVEEEFEEMPEEEISFDF